MDESTISTSDVAAVSEPPQPTSEPAYAAHETDVTPDSGRTNTPIYPTDPNAQPEPDPYGDMLRYKERGYTEKPLRNEEFFEKRRREREGVNTSPESLEEIGIRPAQQQPAFDLATAYDDFIAKPEDRGALPILTHLYESNQPAYVSLLNDAILSNWQYAAALLADRGHIPEYFGPRPATVDPNDPWLADVPEHLRETALALEPAVWEQIGAMDDPEAQARVLEDQRELQQHRQAEAERRQEEERQQQEATEKEFEGIMAKGDQSANDLLAEHMAGHMLHLEREFSPFGDKEANRGLHQFILGLGAHQVLQDPEARVMDNNIYAHLAHAAFHQKLGNSIKAQGHERNAKWLAEKLNARITEARDAYVNLSRSSFYGGYRQPAQTNQSQQDIH